MSDPSAITPVGRATAVFAAEPTPTLTCSHCEAVVSDDDAQCPRCDSPIDWGASIAALREWQKAGGAESSF